jgi:hypothetical protein
MAKTETAITKAQIRRYQHVAIDSPLLTAREHGYAVAAQGRTLNAGASREAQAGYYAMQDAMIDLGVDSE